MKMLLIATALATVMFGNAAAAFFITGNKLHSDCNSDLNYSLGACIGYVAGVADAAQRELPSQTILRQIVDVVKIYLQNHPEDRHFSARSLVVYAIEEAFHVKCKKASQH